MIKEAVLLTLCLVFIISITNGEKIEDAKSSIKSSIEPDMMETAETKYKGGGGACCKKGGGGGHYHGGGGHYYRSGGHYHGGGGGYKGGKGGGFGKFKKG